MTKDISLNNAFAQGVEAPGTRLRVLLGALSAGYPLGYWAYLSEARRRRPEWIGVLSGGVIQ